METVKLHSSQQKPGAIILGIFLLVAWVFALIWLLTAFYSFEHAPGWALILVIASCAYMVYLIAESGKLRESLRNKFVLTIDKTLVRLKVDEGKKVYENVMSLDNIDTIEVYRYWDDGSVVLKGKNDTMEIPLWAFPQDQSRILRLLQNSHAEVISVP